MARRLRIQFPGARYHVINRGNYRRDVFDTPGAADAFVAVLDEACSMFAWRVHGYVVMRNHFHLALETPEPNLVEGMHWLQSTYATRFNRFRAERGHLFQGRYQSLLVENEVAMGRVVDYIHLNPVRARIVPLEHVAGFRWSSLNRFRQSQRPAWLVTDWLAGSGWKDSAEGWADYVRHLEARFAGENNETVDDEHCRGWAIGSTAWRQAMAAEHQHLALNPGITSAEVTELRRARWEAVLKKLLQAANLDRADVVRARKSAPWKCDMAADVRAQAGAPHAWIAEALAMGTPQSVRALLCRRRKNQQTTA